MANAAKVAPNGLPFESVWDYPRPPALVPCERQVRVEHGGTSVADSRKAVRILETASPPTIYIPAADIRMELLTPSGGRATICEWKGPASYFDLSAENGTTVERAAWTYEEPREPFGALLGHYAFYAGRVDRCLMDDELVDPQAGSFYGGWVTAEIEGPMKGDPGTLGW